MRREKGKGKRRKKVKVVNRERFIFSLALIISIIFGLTFSVKAIFNKINENENYVGDEEKNKLEKNEDLKEEEKSEEESLVFNNENNIKKEVKEEVKEEAKEEVKEEAKEIEKADKGTRYKEIFQDSLFIGDSITDSLSAYEILEEKNVIAKLGLTLTGVKQELGNIDKSNFSNVYILFGMNDILMGIDSQKFVENYKQVIYIIREKLPNANIYVQSILPVLPKATRKRPLLTNSKIDEFNQALLRMCEEENITFVNLRSIIPSQEDLHEPDGIHFKYKFYNMWLNYLIQNAK